MIVATFLDASMQKLPLISTYCQTNEVNMSDLLIKKWTQYKPQLPQKKQTVTNPDQNQPTFASKMIQKHVSQVVSQEDGFESEIRLEYLKYSAIADIVNDPLEWWKTHEAAFPHLSALSKILLSIPSSSGATEHHWSEAGHLINKKKRISIR